MTNQEYIAAHKDEDVRSLALRGALSPDKKGRHSSRVSEGIDGLWCLKQIEGYQLAKKKLPRWADIEGIIFPPRLSMEQCSSELTAEYKASIVKRLGGKSICDLTGGFGVDFSYMAKNCSTAIYVECQEVLCQTAKNNLPLLGLPQAEVWNMDAEEAIDRLAHVDIINIDPARRNACGRKVAAIEDCTPNLIKLQSSLLYKADHVIVKLSPMLDITQALRELHNVCEVHVVSVKNECKELLFILSSLTTDLSSLTYHSVNLGTNDTPFATTTRDATITLSKPEQGMLLIEPNASIMKAGLQDVFALQYGLMKLHPLSHLYVTTTQTLNNIPGRVFRIKAVLDFSKQNLRHLQQELKKANLSIRNFPSSVNDLRKRLKIQEGGNEYLFATTLIDSSSEPYTSSHAIIRCEKA